MEQTRALNALAPYIALTRSANSPRAAADLIERATSAPNTYIFAELLETPEIQALANSPNHSSYLKLLEIFSYGTYQTYCRTSSLPKLNTVQTIKLRQLSFLTLATNPANLSYDALLFALGLETHRELESLVISVIYAGLVECTLDPYNKRVIVASISPLRDLEPNSMPSMIKALDEWSSRCSSTLTDLEKYISRFKTEAFKRQRYKFALATEVEELVEGKIAEGEGNNVVAEKKADAIITTKGGGLNIEDNNAMDIDNEEFNNT
ncbi:COP9 signalosome complex subunit 7a [Erysiphe neolycopersici]|uniref:COP9 signalosome complex subunit 7a n=1 Tax=Erysiphe neolycopersici TaxID=212602 RepID=A0A420HJX2_9PEZI|nr:COP9 signalosome complex subunit 7a [Erysiphe neolycopersici]